MSGTNYSPFAMAQAQFDKVADHIDLDSSAREILRVPMREYSFSLPVRMDDGTTRVFQGYRIQHNDARGPAKGGIRFHPQETMDTVRALSMWMSWKTAVLNLPLGGGKGGVICDPHNLSSREQEQICRLFVRQLGNNIGPDRDVPAPDVMTNSQHMLWMMDEYEALHGQRSPGVITGKPVGSGGSLGRTEATGFGVVFTIREALRELKIAPQETSAAVQGFGNVAQYAIRLYQQMGGKVTCVSCWDQHNQEAFTCKLASGIDLDQLLSITDRFGGIDREQAIKLGYEILPGDSWIDEDVNILIPSALENQINKDNVERISPRVKVIAEGANGPTTPEADEVIKERGIFMIPDFLCNAGGVTCSYFEQVQCNSNYFWEKDEVLGKLDVKMTSAFHDVSNCARQEDVYMRDAAYIIAISRVAQACRDRGWI